AVLGLSQTHPAVDGNPAAARAVCTPSVSRSVRLFTNTKRRAAAAVGVMIRRRCGPSRGIIVGREAERPTAASRFDRSHHPRVRGPNRTHSEPLDPRADSARSPIGAALAPALRAPCGQATHTLT